MLGWMEVSAALEVSAGAAPPGDRHLLSNPACVHADGHSSHLTKLWQNWQQRRNHALD